MVLGSSGWGVGEKLQDLGRKLCVAQRKGLWHPRCQVCVECLIVAKISLAGSDGDDME